MPGILTVGERIILHLAQYTKYIDSYDAPLDISQDGIAAALRISRAHAAIELKKLKDSGEVVEKLVHIKRGKTKRKAYFLSSPGEERARKIQQYAESEGIDIQPFLDLKKCKGPELWEALDDELKSVLAMACVFRRPFERVALPETSVSLLPVGEDGLVNMPPDLKAYVPGQVAPELLRQYHSGAADYWLDHGDYRERLYHLLRAGRTREAEMLLASKGPKALGEADKDLLGIVSLVPTANERYRGRVLYAQAEAARGAGDLDGAMAKAAELKALPSEKDRFDGLVVEGLTLRAKGEYATAVQCLVGARSLSEGAMVNLECEIADTMVQAGRLEEAEKVLSALTAQGAKDGEELERIFYLMGVVRLRSGDGSNAVRYFSKSRGAARDKENGELYLRLSDAYGMMGLTDKAEEYAVRAKKLRAPRSSI